uniref:Putative ankyrin repeat domain-containing protein 19 n=1 Tax=Marmota marmota marmota TaxID=9994 RepID=A0A8C6A8B3_MARMA
MEKLSMYHFPPAHSSFSKSRYWAWLGLIDYEAPGKKLKPVLQQNSIQALQYLEEKCATILLENGADPNAHNNQNETPLHFALSLKKTSLVEKLLSLNADIEARTTRGYTPLLLAIEQNRQQMVETLIQNKANIHAVDQKGRTALMFALEQKSKHVVEMLLQSGIDVSAADNFGQMALAYAIASGDTNLKELILQYMKVESKHPENINPGTGET